MSSDGQITQDTDCSSRNLRDGLMFDGLCPVSEKPECQNRIHMAGFRSRPNPFLAMDVQINQDSALAVVAWPFRENRCR